MPMPVYTHTHTYIHSHNFLNEFFWSRIALQRCISFWCTAKWISYIQTCISSSLVSCPFRSPQSIEQSSLCHIVGSHSAQFSSVTQSCLTLCDPMNRSTPGLPVHHQLPEFTQTHVHRVSDAIQPSHPLSSLPPPAPNPSQHQGLFQWVNSSHEVLISHLFYT